MSDVKHTPEPWHAYNNETYWEVLGDEHSIGDVCASNHNGFHNGEENARRIVACVNACAIFSTEDLEDYPLVSEHGFSIYEAVKAERDELLAALKHHQELTRPIQRSIDIIAKCEANHG